MGQAINQSIDHPNRGLPSTIIILLWTEYAAHLAGLWHHVSSPKPKGGRNINVNLAHTASNPHGEKKGQFRFCTPYFEPSIAIPETDLQNSLHTLKITFPYNFRVSFRPKIGQKLGAAIFASVS